MKQFTGLRPTIISPWQDCHPQFEDCGLSRMCARQQCFRCGLRCCLSLDVSESQWRCRHYQVIASCADRRGIFRVIVTGNPHCVATELLGLNRARRVWARRLAMIDNRRRKYRRRCARHVKWSRRPRRYRKVTAATIARQYLVCGMKSNVLTSKGENPLHMEGRKAKKCASHKKDYG